jgi:magnesium-transporting ATPase (P-type)
MLIFFSLTGVTLLAWERSHPGLNAYTVNTVRGGAWFFASFLTAVFAALGGIWRGSAWRRRGRITRRLWLRWALLILCGALLGGTLAFGARSFGPTWQQLDAARWITSARIQAEDQWIRFESEVNTLIDRVYLLYYDRRAPAQPVVEPSPQATRPAEGEAP